MCVRACSEIQLSYVPEKVLQPSTKMAQAGLAALLSSQSTVHSNLSEGGCPVSGAHPVSKSI